MTDTQPLPHVTIYQGSDDWSAVYLNGALQRVGDHYLADEWVRDYFGVELIQSDDFLRGGNQRTDVAKTLDDLEAYAKERNERIARASQIRAEAERLRAEADALEAQR